MAETVDEIKQNIAQILQLFKQATSDVVQEVMTMMGRSIDGVSSGAEKGLDNLGKKVKEVADMTGEEFVSAISDKLGNFNLYEHFGATNESDVAKIATDFAKSMNSSLARELGGIELPLNFKPDSLIKGASDAFSGLKSFIENNGIDLTAMAGTELTKQAFDTLTTDIQKIEKNITSFQGPAATMFAGFSKGVTEADANLLNLDTSIMTYGTRITDLAMKTGVSVDNIKTSLASLAQAGVDMSEFQNLSLTIDTGDSVEEIDALSAAFRISKATGIETGEVGKILFQGMRQLGSSGKEAIEMFGALKSAQEGTNLTFQSVSNTIMEQASKFRFFGNNVEGAAAMYKNFINTVGEGKEALAGELFSNVMTGIQGMNDGMKAFIGMTGQVGLGSSGAIGGMLKVEQAMATGDLSGILNDVKEMMTRFTGSEILNREQALNSGQEQEYFMQRQLLGQAIGVKDPGQADMIMKMLQQGQQVTTADIQTSGKAELGGLMDQSDDVINRQVGAFTKLSNVMSAGVFDASVRLGTGFSQLGENMNTIIEPMNELNNVFRSFKEYRKLNSIEDPGVKMPSDSMTSEERLQANEEMARPDFDRIALELGVKGSSADISKEAADQGIAGNIMDQASLARAANLGVAGTSADMASQYQFPSLKLNMPDFQSEREDINNMVNRSQQATKQVKLMIDEQPLTLKIQVDTEGTNLNIRPFIEQAGQRTSEIMRKISISEIDGTIPDID